MNKTTTNPRVYVELTAVWGNDDASSSIKVSRRRWQEIQNGAEHSKSTWSWYEGRRQSVHWLFTNGEVSIDGEDGRQCIVGLPVDSLHAYLTSPLN